MNNKATKTDLSDRWVLGVIGGICKHYRIDPFIFRLCYLALILFTSGIGIPVYLILALLMPSEPYDDD